MTITCSLGGWLVNADGWVPSAAFDFSWGGVSRPVIGCNNLRCSKCGEQVRSWPGFTTTRAHDPLPLPRIDDPNDEPGVDPSQFERLYACGCRWWPEPSDSATGQVDSDRQYPYAVWSCDGHPPIELPVTLAGVEVGDPPGPDLIRHQLAEPGERLPDGLTLDQAAVPAFWVVRLHRLLLAAGYSQTASDIETCVSSLVDDDSAVVRVGAVSFINVTPDAEGAAAVVRVVTRDPVRYAGTASWGDQSWNLSSWATDLLLRVWNGGGDGSDAAKAAVRASATTPGAAAKEFIVPLAMHDPEWFEQNVALIATAAPKELASILRNLEHWAPTDLATLVRDTIANSAISTQDAAEQIHRLPDGSSKEELLQELGLPS
ncbi:MAG: hypothetical protein ACR2H3_04425 [Acidimicrobiales bacterium]